MLNWLEQFRVHESLASLPEEQVVAIALIAIGLVVVRTTWSVFGLPVTIVHELGHAIAALTAGYRLRGITVNGDMSGATNFWARGTAGALWTMWWGYPSPAVVGIGLMWAASQGWSRVALWVLVAGLAFVFLLSRSVHTVLVVLVTGGALGGIAYWGSPLASTIVVFAVAWLLLVGSVRALANVTRSHLSRRWVNQSDAYLMARRLRAVPAPVWLLTMWAAVGGCAWYGVDLLLGAIGRW